MITGASNYFIMKPVLLYHETRITLSWGSTCIESFRELTSRERLRYGKVLVAHPSGRGHSASQPRFEARRSPVTQCLILPHYVNCTPSHFGYLADRPELLTECEQCCCASNAANAPKRKGKRQIV
jgi:hypothetical protein